MKRPGLLRILTAPARALPDFLIIGAQKCGTTFLYNNLVLHTDVAQALTKEVHYFDTHFERGERWYRAHFARKTELLRGDRRVLTGESSPYYIFHPCVARRAAACVPGARLIALLRDPVERAYSHYHHNVRQGHEKLSFEEALEAEAARTVGERERLLQRDETRSEPLLRYTYQARGLYADQIEEWMRYFPREQLIVLESERLVHESGSVLEEAQRFLGLTPQPEKSPGRHNAGEYGPMEPSIRDRLTNYFRPHNERLFAFLGRRFSWRG